MSPLSLYMCADARKVRGNIHWLSAAHAVPAEVRLYDRLFAVPFPGMRRPPGTAAEGVVAAEAALHPVVVAGDDDDDDGDAAERSWLDDLNPDSKCVITAYVEPSLGGIEPGEVFQFERHGYFVTDLRDHMPHRPVFNRTVTLKDSWAPR